MEGTLPYDLSEEAPAPLPQPLPAIDIPVPALPLPGALQVDAVSKADALPAGGVLYKVDSSHASFGELARECRGITLVVAWISKVLRLRLPGGVNDPNVESLRPFEGPWSAIPRDMACQIEPLVDRLGRLGFDVDQRVCHVIVDVFNKNHSFLVSMPHAEGLAVARVHLRKENSSRRVLYSELLTELSDGGFLCSTSARGTLDAPEGVTVRRQVGAQPEALWQSHTQAIDALPPGVSVMLTLGTQSVLDMLERHHVKCRDLHLSRKLFQPMSDKERQSVASVGTAYTSAAARGFAYPEVLAEIERLQTRRSSWKGGIALLLVSLLAFLAAEAGGASGSAGHRMSSDILITIVLILFFHELGHYLAMRLFRYRNVRMFFIPFFGAAVSGTNYTAPGWKKVIVALMGPLPGIIVGAGVGIAGLVLHRDMLTNVGLLALIINGSNLLPVLPLDGGRVMQSLLFSRHYAADVVFRVIAGLALVGIAAMIGEKFLMYIAIAIVIGAPAAWRLGRIAQDLKRQGLAPANAEGDQIPPDLAQTIIDRVKTGSFRAVKQNNKVIAQQSLTVYETLCTRSPGWLASSGFAVVHVGAIAFALVMILALMIGKGGSLARFARAAARQPTHRIAAQNVVLVRGGNAVDAVTDATDTPQKTLLANFHNAADADVVFGLVRARLSSGQEAELFGQTLLVSWPQSDDAARRSFVGQIERQTKDFSVSASRFGSGVLRFACLAPTGDVAQQLEAEMDEYAQMPREWNLIPPWSPAASADAAAWARYHIARGTYVKLLRAGSQIYQDPKYVALSNQALEARQQGDTATVEKISRRQNEMADQGRRQEIDRLRNSADAGIDRVVVDNYLQLPVPKISESESEDEDMKPVDFTTPPYKAMAERMGQFAPTSTSRDHPRGRFGAYGNMTHVGLLMSVEFMTFNDPVDGSNAFIHWLDSHGCKDMKYEFNTGADLKGLLN